MARGNVRLEYCSFCGKSQTEVDVLIAGPVVFICDECVALCGPIIEEKRRSRALARHDKPEIGAGEKT